MEQAVVEPLPPQPLSVQPTLTVKEVPATAAPVQMEILPPWHTRFGIEYGSDVDDLSRFGFGLLANHTGSIGIDTGFRLHREHGADFRDHLWLGDFNIVYELFPTQYIRPRAGVGVNWLADSYGAEMGLNMTVGADVFLGPAWTLTGELDFGTLGDADFFHGNVAAGIMQGEHLEWFAGYDHLDVGGVQISGVVSGIRFRF